MQDLIVILVLYVVVLVAFAWCGGMRAAGRAIEGWGRHSASSAGRSAAPPAEPTPALPLAAWMQTPSRSACSAASSRSSARHRISTRSR